MMHHEVLIRLGWSKLINDVDDATVPSKPPLANPPVPSSPWCGRCSRPGLDEGTSRTRVSQRSLSVFTLSSTRWCERAVRLIVSLVVAQADWMTSCLCLKLRKFRLHCDNTACCRRSSRIGQVLKLRCWPRAAFNGRLLAKPRIMSSVGTSDTLT